MKKQQIPGQSPHQIPPELIEAARNNPNSFVYKIDGSYPIRDPLGDAVPASAIVGAWKVDGSGNITGDFVPNPNYRPWKPEAGI